MHINWLGQTCIKIQTKNEDQEAKITINSYKPKTGNFPRSLSPDIGLFSSLEKNRLNLANDTFVIDSPGEFELKGIVIYSIPNTIDNHIFKLSTEEMTIVHLGNLKRKLDNGELEFVSSPDILLIPIGGNDKYLNYKQAAELATTMEPRIIIPIGYKCDTDPNVDPVSKFISEIGIKPEKENGKVIIKKKDLPQDSTQLIVLEKE